MVAKVLILGVSGMLGAMVFDVFSREKDMETDVTVRNDQTREYWAHYLKGVSCHLLDVEKVTQVELKRLIREYDWVINAIGITKPYIKDDDAHRIDIAVKVNSRFPYLLGKAAEGTNVKVLQIATDCVYSGIQGKYAEDALHDALDGYGKTKSLGEVWFPNVHHLRCSIVGPEPEKDIFLLAWVLNQPKTAEINGFVNHDWNGITTLHYAKVCMGIIRHRVKLEHLQHIIPTALLTKYELVNCFAREYGRKDIKINETEAKTVIDRTLSTNNEELNQHIWEAAGYKRPPSISQMIIELAEYKFQMRRKNS